MGSWTYGFLALQALIVSLRQWLYLRRLAYLIRVLLTHRQYIIGINEEQFKDDPALQHKQQRLSLKQPRNHYSQSVDSAKKKRLIVNKLLRGFLSGLTKSHQHTTEINFCWHCWKISFMIFIHIKIIQVYKNEKDDLLGKTIMFPRFLALNNLKIFNQKIILHLKSYQKCRSYFFSTTLAINSLHQKKFLAQSPVQKKHSQKRLHVIQNGNFRICNYIIYISVEIIHHLCMQKHQRNYKVKQDQRDSNPIYKIVTNKIRNINKKLSQLNQLQSSDKKGLTQAQLAKLAKREELAQDLAKQEDFLAYYKQLVVENNLVYDKVDDLIKISTLLTVGKRIQKEKYCPDETKEIFNQIYNQIFSKSIYNSKNQLSDEIIRVYRLLETYLEKNKYYSECKDYMTYIKEIDLRKPNKTLNQSSASQIIQHVQQINSLIKGKPHIQNQVKVEEKTKNLVIIKQVIHFKQENSKLAQKIEEIKNEMKSHLLQKQLIEACPKLQKISESESTLPDLEDRRKDSYTQMADQSFLKCQSSSKSGDFSKKGQPRENNSQEKVKQNNSSKRKRKNKKHNYVQVLEIDNMRKCSEMLCDTTSEMPKSKKVRYVEKVQ